VRIILFLFISLILLWVSRRSLRNVCSHGFYRFFAFEGVVALVLLNHPYWFEQPFALRQLVSWCLLACSVAFVLHGVQLLRIVGGQEQRQDMPENLAFENTVNLVEVGLYRFIRHPMYASLLFLAWGALLKHPAWQSLVLALWVSAFLIATAKIEERENLRFFGHDYRAYCERSKMFIPFLF
jgi:protein-S-isoprenylcysteine O-methyltransferase Ste14